MTDYLGLLCNPKKDAHSLITEALGIEINTLSMQPRLSQSKIAKVTQLGNYGLAAGSLTLLDAQNITSFCPSTVVWSL